METRTFRHRVPFESLHNSIVPASVQFVRPFVQDLGFRV